MNTKLFLGIVLVSYTLSVGAQTSVNNDSVIQLTRNEILHLIESSTQELRESNTKLMLEVLELKKQLNSKVSSEDLEQLSLRLTDEILGLIQEFVERNNEQIKNETVEKINNYIANLHSEIEQLVNQKNSVLNEELMEVISKFQGKIIDETNAEIQNSRDELMQTILEKIESEIKALNQTIDNQNESIIKFEKKIRGLKIE